MSRARAPHRMILAPGCPASGGAASIPDGHGWRMPRVNRRAAAGRPGQVIEMTPRETVRGARPCR